MFVEDSLSAWPLGTFRGVLAAKTELEARTSHGYELCVAPFLIRAVRGVDSKIVLVFYLVQVSVLHENLSIPVVCKIRLWGTTQDSIEFARLLAEAGCQV